jgi:hypothetical protein
MFTNKSFNLFSFEVENQEENLDLIFEEISEIYRTPVNAWYQVITKFIPIIKTSKSTIYDIDETESPYANIKKLNKGCNSKAIVNNINRTIMTVKARMMPKTLLVEEEVA